jgi:NhaA family Na+:H+ antiporter
MTVPARTRLDPHAFLKDARDILRVFESEGDVRILKSGKRQAAVATLETACEHVQSPMQRLEDGLQPWVKVLIMPVFALANAGIVLGPELASAFKDRVAMGIIAGLLIGKPLGIVSFAWFAVRVRAAELPDRVGWTQVLGTGFLGGIGFTMSLFIANLAFGGASQLDISKAGVLAGSIVAGLLGCAFLWRTNRSSSTRQSSSRRL